MSASAARSTLWGLGLVAPWYLRPSQFEVYELLMRERYPFVQAGRRWGKTTTILSFVLEQLRANPGWICRWVFPEKKTARTVIAEEMEKIQADCPDELKFRWQSTDSVYIGPRIRGRRSKIFLYGVDKDKGKSLRGEASHIVVADEYGFWSDPSVIRRVLRPTTLTTRGKIIFASTPSEDLDHPYYQEREKAQRKGRFIQKTIHDNESLSLEDIQNEMEEAGGEQSETWRREYLCGDVANPTLLVCPEWSDSLNVVPDDYPRPEFFDAYIGGDHGVDDNTAGLVGYYDCLKDEIVIEAEHVASGKTTRDHCDAMKVLELQTWGVGVKPFMRVWDAPEQVLVDMNALYGYWAHRPEKDQKHASIHFFRQQVRLGKFKVKARCQHTIRNIKYGRWKDEKRMDFQRTEQLGHLDAFAAAVYFNRSVDRSHSPWPAYPAHVSPATHFIPRTSSEGSPQERSLASAFVGPSLREDN